MLKSWLTLQLCDSSKTDQFFERQKMTKIFNIVAELLMKQNRLLGPHTEDPDCSKDWRFNSTQYFDSTSTFAYILTKLSNKKLMNFPSANYCCVEKEENYIQF